MLNFIDFSLEIPEYGTSREFWTETALECYQRGCNCRDCEIPHPTGFCNMKSSVLALVRQFGNPDEIIKEREGEREKDRIRNEIISEGIAEGKTQKQIAKELDISVYTLKKYMQQAGVRIQFEKMYRS